MFNRRVLESAFLIVLGIAIAFLIAWLAVHWLRPVEALTLSRPEAIPINIQIVGANLPHPQTILESAYRLTE